MTHDHSRTQARATDDRRRIRAKRARRRASLGMEVLEDRQLLAVVTWDGGAGTDAWADVANWSNNALPGSGDDVVIPAAAVVPGGTVIYNIATSATIRSLTASKDLDLNGGTLAVTQGTSKLTGMDLGGTGILDVNAGATLQLAADLNGILNNYGTLSWTAGTITGPWSPDSPLALNNFGSMTWTGGTVAGSLYNFSDLTITGAGSKALDGGEFYNYGGATTTWSDSEIHFAHYGSFGNGGTVDMQGDVSAVDDGTGGFFTNNGVLIRSAGGTTTLGVFLTNDGTVEIRSSTLSLAVGGGSYLDGGDFVLTGGGVLSLEGGTYTLSADSTVLGDSESSGGKGGGALAVNGGTFEVLPHTSEDAINVDAIAINGGNLSYGGGFMRASLFELASGALTLDAYLHIGDRRTFERETFVWTGGTINGPETLEIDFSAADAIITGDAPKTLSGGTFWATGTLYWTGGTVDLEGGATLKTAGEILIQGDVTVRQVDEASSFVNYGSVYFDEGRTLTVQGSLTNSLFPQLSASAPATLKVQGDLVGDAQDPGLFGSALAVILDGSGDASSPQRLEVMGKDLGNTVAGLSNNFAIHSLELGDSTYVRLVDDADNSPGAGAEALYLGSLKVPAGTTLDLNGLNLYVSFADVAGTVIGGTLHLLPDATLLNHAPSFTKGADQVVAEDSGARSVPAWATAISPGPALESGQAVDFLVTNDNNALFSAQPAIDASGLLTFTPAPNAHGVAIVTVRLHDDGGTDGGGVDTSAPQTFTITVTAVNDHPTLAPIADQAMGAGGVVAVALDAADVDGDPLGFGAAVDSLASVLQQEYGFLTLDGNFRTDRYGRGEKWFYDRSLVRYFILPDGSLYRATTPVTAAVGTLVDVLDTSYAADPRRLFNARPGGFADVSVSGSTLTVTPRAGSVGGYYVTAIVSDGHGGTASRRFRVWSGVGSNTAPVLGPIADQAMTPGTPVVVALDASDPDGDALVTYARADSLAYVLQRQYGFMTTDGNFRTDRYGRGEKWFYDRSLARYFILPDGSLYRATTPANAAVGTLVDVLDPSYAADPRQLFNATAGGGVATVSVSGSTLTVTPAAGAAADFVVTVTVSDGRGGMASRQFRVSRAVGTNTAPTLGPIADQSVAPGGAVDVALSASDPDGDAPFIYARADSLAYVLEQQYGFFTVDGNFQTDRYGRGEKWFDDRNRARYFILPDGSLYRAATPVMAAVGTLIDVLDPSYAADPRRLFNVRAGGVDVGLGLDASGTTLTVTRDAGSVADFFVTVTVGDGRGGTASRRFRVTNS